MKYLFIQYLCLVVFLFFIYNEFFVFANVVLNTPPPTPEKYLENNFYLYSVVDNVDKDQTTQDQD